MKIYKDDKSKNSPRFGHKSLTQRKRLQKPDLPFQEKPVNEVAQTKLQSKEGKVLQDRSSSSFQAIADNSPRAKQPTQLQSIADHFTGQRHAIQRTPAKQHTTSGTGVIQRYIIHQNRIFQNPHAFIQAATPLIMSALGSKAPQVAQALGQLPPRAMQTIRRRLYGYLMDGQQRTLESVVKEAVAFLKSLAAGPRGVASTKYGVVEHSRNEDFQTHSSDVRGFIARNVGSQEFPIPHYVGNPTVLSGNQALVPGHGSSFSMHPSLRVSSPEREIMWLLSSSGQLLFGNRPVNLRRPHPTMIGGEAPQALSGGTLTMHNNQISAIRDDSGHFQPGRSGVSPAIGAFNRLPSTVFHPEFTGFRAYGMEENTGFGRTHRAEMMLQGRQLLEVSQAIINQMQNRLRSDNQALARNLPQQAIEKIAGRHLTLLEGIEGDLGRIEGFVVQYMPYFNAALRPVAQLMNATIGTARRAMQLARQLLANPTAQNIRLLHPLYHNIERFFTIFQQAEQLLRNTSTTSTSSFGVKTE